MITCARGRERARFEVGFRSLGPGIDGVWNPRTRQVEEIYAVEVGSREGTDYVRVETRPGEWYDLDGHTILARRLR